MIKQLFIRLQHPALLCLLTLFCFLPCQAQEIADRVDELMTAAMKSDHFNGSILITRNGKVIVSKGYGMSNIENDIPNTSQTKFRIGSLTKQFTAMAIMMLQERGKLNIEHPVCNYLTNCPEAWKPVTIHHLLTHSSGIPDYVNVWGYEKVLASPSPATDILEIVKKAPVEFKPGKRFSYSSLGYILLGSVIEKSSGMSYEAFLRENIFKPLKMENTGYDNNKAILKHRAAGYSLQRNTLINAPYIDMSLPFAAGGLYSTVEDLQLWDEALYTEKLVGKKSLDAIFTAYAAEHGYGWQVTRHLNRKFIGHGGWINGFASSIARYPEDKLCVIVLSNLDSVPVNTIARSLAATAFGLKQTAPVQRKAIKLNPQIYDRYIGEYQLAPNFFVAVTREGDKLMGQATGQPKVELLPESDIEFFVKEYDAQIMFVYGDAGQITGAVVTFNGQQTQGEKIK
ncbi:MAG TPA: serine hydrolase [Pyrinomonadaceae bacterium]|jgi:CubicO group peptidase (beta-lactamase class C family)